MNGLGLPRLRGLSLFSGIGGIDLAISEYVIPAAYCENDRYAQAVLMSRQVSGHLPIAPIWDDVRTLRAEMLPPVDIIYGGFPCQDISVAGNGRGMEGERSGLFFEISRLASEAKPRFLFLENVPAIRTRGLDRVIASLSDLRYDLRWCALSAEEVGAPHKRNRWWMLGRLSDAAYPIGEHLWFEQGRSRRPQGETPSLPRFDGEAQSMADSSSPRCNEGIRRESGAIRNEARWSQPERLGDEMAHSESLRRRIWRPQSERIEGRFGASSDGYSLPNSHLARLEGRDSGVLQECASERAARPSSALTQQFDRESAREWWQSESGIRRVASNVPNRVDRLRCLGNAVCVPSAKEAFEKLMGLK